MTLRCALMCCVCVSVTGLMRPLAFADEPSVPAESTPPAVEPKGGSASTTTAKRRDTTDAKPETRSVNDDDVSAGELRSAPPPGQVHGMVNKPQVRVGALRSVARVVFFIPKWILFGVATATRGAVWMWERFTVTEWIRNIFFNDGGTFGLYPTALFEAGFGLNIGGRLVWRDVLGRGEKITARAGYGGRFAQRYSARLTSGDRFGPLGALLRLRYERRGKDRFFGIGHADTTAVGDINPPIDSLTSDTAVDTRFSHRIARADVSFGGKYREFFARFTEAISSHTFGAADEDEDDTSIEEVYDTSRITGFDRGLFRLYSQLEVGYDSRRRTSRYTSEAMWAKGYLLSGFAGYTAGLKNDDSRFWRYGADAQAFFDLFASNRILSVRAFAEGVTGALDEIPFVDLPHLGGPLLLRGFQQDRFRDRAAAQVSVEYMWALRSNSIAAFVFVDVGTVAPRFRDLDLDPDELRWGYGGGLQFVSPTSFGARVHLSTSREGGVLVNFALDPIYDTRSRLDER